MQRAIEVGVVGAGIVGLAIARELAGRGAEVTVLERAGIGSGASGVQPGGVRQQWGTAVACRLARESVAFYARAAENLRSPVELRFDRCGYLFVAHSHEALASLAASVEVQNAEGIPSRRVTAEEAARLVPGLRTDSLAGGAWCAEDGYFDRPQSVVEAFARGLDIRIADVVGLEAGTNGWTMRLGDGTAAHANAVVVAAGAATPGLVGSDLAIEREDRYLFLSDPIKERLLEPLVVSTELAFAAKQLANGRVLASDLSARGDEAKREAWRARINDGVRELLPQLEFVSFPLLVRGEYDVTPDHQPVLGEVAQGLFVAAGFSGHGFMIAPAVGRLVAGAVCGAGTDETLWQLSAERFREHRAIAEHQLV